jgi:hypothetical protein
MTDVLAERLAALADRSDDSDWLDVRRRAHRRRRGYVVAGAAAAAAIVAAAGLAAGGSWLFSSHDRQVTAVTHVSLHGHTWRVALTTRAGKWLGRVCVQVSRSSAPAPDAGCVWTTSRILGPALGARHFDVDGGQIWTGSTVGFAREVAITDTSGHVHTTRTIAAPRGTKTPFRYWALALDTPARSISVYGANGRVLTKRL